MPKGFKRTALCSAVLALSSTHSAFSRNLFVFDTPYRPHGTGQGFLTSSQEGSAYLDGLLPVGGDENRLFFVDGLFMQGRNKQQVSSLALGLRQRRATMFGDALIGSYIAGDYLKTLKGRNAWVINPGLEILTVHNDARLNVYTPLGKRDKTWGTSMASELPQDVIDDSGLPGSDLVRATGNTFIDTPVALLEEIPTGVELEVGQQIVYGTWVRAGVYYFSYKNAKSTRGIEASVDVPLQNKGAHLLLMDSIDNRRNNLFSVGIRFDVGDTGEDRAGITKRMTDPLRRHLASVQVGSAVPVRLGYKANGPSIETDDVFFFTEDAGGAPFAPELSNHGICTAENPCVLTQANINAIEALVPSGAHYFIAAGTAMTTGELTFNGGENGSSVVWGFDSDKFNHQAVGDDRPLINGSLFWGSVELGATDSSGTVKGLQINSNNNQTARVLDGQSGFAEDAQIGVGATGNMTVENTAIAVRNIQDVTGNAYNNAFAIFAGDNATVTSTSATVTVGGTATATAGDQKSNNKAYGIYAQADTDVTASTISVTAAGSISGTFDMTAENRAIAIQATNIDIEDSTLNATTSGNSTGTSVRSETDNQAFAVKSVGGGKVSVSDSTLHARADGNASGAADNYAMNSAGGVVTENNGNITITNSNITVEAQGNAEGEFDNNHSGNKAYGVVTVTGDVEIDDSQISAIVRGDTFQGDTYHFAAAVFSGHNATITGSQLLTDVSGETTGAGAGYDVYHRSYGVFANNNVNIENSTVTAAARGDVLGGNSSHIAKGVVGNNVSARDTTVSVSSSGDTTLGNGFEHIVYGIDAYNIELYDTTITAEVSDDTIGMKAVSRVYGLKAANNIEITNSHINATASGYTLGDNTEHLVVGVEASHDAIINGGSTITVVASGDTSGNDATDNATHNAYGVKADNAVISGATIDVSASGDALVGNITHRSEGVAVTGNVTMNNTKIQVNTSGSAAGTEIFMVDSVTALTTDGSNNICIENGTEVDCF